MTGAARTGVVVYPFALAGLKADERPARRDGEDSTRLGVARLTVKILTRSRAFAPPRECNRCNQDKHGVFERNAEGRARRCASRPRTARLRLARSGAPARLRDDGRLRPRGA